MPSVMCSLLGKPKDNKRYLCGISAMLCTHGGVSSKLGLSLGRPSPKELIEDAGARFKSMAQGSRTVLFVWSFSLVVAVE